MPMSMDGLAATFEDVDMVVDVDVRRIATLEINTARGRVLNTSVQLVCGLTRCQLTAGDGGRCQRPTPSRNQ